MAINRDVDTRIVRPLLDAYDQDVLFIWPSGALHLKTVGETMRANGGLAPGFDFLRVALSITVVAWHCFPIANGSKWPESAPVVWFLGYSILAMFFALSGFLIAGSATRLSLKNFLINRGLRIFPALVVEIVLSAIVLGYFFSTLPGKEYYSNPQTYRYFANISGLISYQLPGVFQNNPSDAVNYSLWTIPYELGCYAVMSCFMVTRMLHRPALVLLFAALFTATSFVLSSIGLEIQVGHRFLNLVYYVFVYGGSRLYVSFVLGIAAFLYRDRLPYDWRLLVLCGLACAIVTALGPAKWMTTPVLNILLGPPTAYICVFLGVTRLPNLAFFDRGDYSYGIYLYGAPIQQAVRAIFSGAANPLIDFCFALPLIVLFAMFSWHCIEKPILTLRKRFSFVARVRGVEGPDESKVGAPPP